MLHILAGSTSSVVAITSMITLAWTIYWALKMHFSVQQINNFKEYADKSNKIITPEIYSRWKDANKGDESTWKDLESTMIQYLNLASEELYLYRSKLIDKKLWMIWRQLITETITSPFARKIMDIHNYDYLREEFISELSNINKDSLRTNASMNSFNLIAWLNEMSDPLFVFLRNITYSSAVLWAGDYIKRLSTTNSISPIGILLSWLILALGYIFISIALLNGYQNFKHISESKIARFFILMFLAVFVSMFGAALILK